VQPTPRHCDAYLSIDGQPPSGVLDEPRRSGCYLTETDWGDGGPNFVSRRDEFADMGFEETRPPLQTREADLVEAACSKP
jgi:hypothetical protein